MRRPVLTLGAYVALRRAGELPPARATVITSDDGYLDNKSVALPALRAAGFPATLFVVTGSLGGSNRWDRTGELSGRPLIDEPGLRELAQSGIEIGNHTRTHPQLPDLTAEQVGEELLGAQADLERAGVAASRVVAYPHGLRSAEVEDVVEQSGFFAACGVDAGLNCTRTSLAALRRTRVDGRHGLIRFAIAVACGDPTPFRTQLKSFRRGTTAAHDPGKPLARHR
jgi:peptidoglycan/xylan/chitin deacetylase (PgdA/CDA1 family)